MYVPTFLNFVPMPSIVSLDRIPICHNMARAADDLPINNRHETSSFHISKWNKIQKTYGNGISGRLHQSRDSSETRVIFISHFEFRSQSIPYRSNRIIKSVSNIALNFVPT